MAGRRMIRFSSTTTLLAAALLFGDVKEAARAEDFSAELEAGWKVQQRWAAVSRNGSFQYALQFRAWNSSNKLKESIERVVRVWNRDGETRLETLEARRDGVDETEKVRAEEARRPPERQEKKEDFPSPFDPRYRGQYVFESGVGESGGEVLSFRPVGHLEHAIAGTASYDSERRLRKVRFSPASLPIFAPRLDFTITFDEVGSPTQADSTGEVSLIVWKRRFEATVAVRDVRLADATSGSPPSTSSP
jgi:hypothetical protein